MPGSWLPFCPEVANLSAATAAEPTAPNPHDNWGPMSNHTPISDGQRDPRPAGPARDFAAFCELDRERRRNSDDDFDPNLFDEAVALVLSRLDRPTEPRPGA